MSPLRVAYVIAALALAPSLLSCAGAASATRPDQISAGEAIGEPFDCSPDKIADDAVPFAVDWADAQRAALEASMSRGVAVVSYTCEGVKILPACRVEGDYAYTGVSKKTKHVKMRDLGQVQVNFGAIVGSVASQVSQGRTLDLAYVLVGVNATTVTDVPRPRLSGRCDGATHFVFDASMGAFTMATSEEGMAKTAAEILALGSTSAEGSSSRSSLTTDGDVDACQPARRSDKAPRDGCAALLRVSLMRISEASPSAQALAANAAAGGAKGDARDCAEGFVFAEGLCQRPGAVEVPLCPIGDAAACEAACAKGSHESCGRFGDVLLRKYSATTWSGTKQDGTLTRAGSKHFARFTAACEEGEAAACSVAGIAALSEPALRGRHKAKEIAAYFASGCAGGEIIGCNWTYEVYGQGLFEPEGMDSINDDIPEGTDMDQVVWRDPTKVIEIIGGACRRGNAAACLLHAGYFLDNGPVEQVSDWDERKAQGLFGLERACYGGFPDACALLAVASMSESGCDDALSGLLKGKQLAPRDVEVTAYAGAFCQALGLDDDTRRARAAEAGCELGSQAACALK